jgi:hypothetical protein
MHFFSGSDNSQISGSYGMALGPCGTFVSEPVQWSGMRNLNLSPKENPPSNFIKTYAEKQQTFSEQN